ncbi:hypothetical protein HYFRA_00000686 [Hymenoscyphus fraxineus]|uniref:Uncharacterized protein n=1 Tax=Hymenoscyphus fraxineus TaxID=746836 RepID=A0A9N9L189_9HELO|nr:hypothetical protein HYFRA_00000686 [Hymenoscyphus fraxineus]
MTEATNTKMMDTEAGGEQTQYEGAQTTQTAQLPGHIKYTGQFNATPRTPEKDDAFETLKKQRGEKTAENIRFGQAISQQGFGGKIVGNMGSAEKASAYGGVKDDGNAEKDTQRTRKEMGYGGGNEVGG